jgi:hypothetical protein
MCAGTVRRQSTSLARPGIASPSCLDKILCAKTLLKSSKINPRMDGARSTSITYSSANAGELL